VGGIGEAEVGPITSKRKITDILTPMENPVRSTIKSPPKTQNYIAYRWHQEFNFSSFLFCRCVELWQWITSTFIHLQAEQDTLGKRG